MSRTGIICNPKGKCQGTMGLKKMKRDEEEDFGEDNDSGFDDKGVLKNIFRTKKLKK